MKYLFYFLTLFVASNLLAQDKKPKNGNSKIPSIIITNRNLKNVPEGTIPVLTTVVAEKAPSITPIGSNGSPVNKIVPPDPGFLEINFNASNTTALNGSAYLIPFGIK